jgi:hypothetical protein
VGRWELFGVLALLPGLIRALLFAMWLRSIEPRAPGA